MLIDKFHPHFAGLTICGVNCLLSAEWKSPSKVIARTGQGDGKGDVIITTKTGGVGSCTVRFNAIPFNPGMKVI